MEEGDYGVLLSMFEVRLLSVFSPVKYILLNILMVSRYFILLISIVGTVCTNNVYFNTY